MTENETPSPHQQQPYPWMTHCPVCNALLWLTPGEHTAVCSTAGQPDVELHGSSYPMTKENAAQLRFLWKHMGLPQVFPCSLITATGAAGEFYTKVVYRMEKAEGLYRRVSSKHPWSSKCIGDTGKVWHVIRWLSAEDELNFGPPPEAPELDVDPTPEEPGAGIDPTPEELLAPEVTDVVA